MRNVQNRFPWTFSKYIRFFSLHICIKDVIGLDHLDQNLFFFLHMLHRSKKAKLESISISNNSRLCTFFGRRGWHQVSHSLPEAWVPCSSAALWPLDGGTLVNQVLQAGGKVFVSLRPSDPQLDQNHTHFPLDQRMVEPHL